MQVPWIFSSRTFRTEEAELYLNLSFTFVM